MIGIAVLPCVSLISAPNISRCRGVRLRIPGIGNVRRFLEVSSGQVASISWLFATGRITIRFTNGSTTGLTLTRPRSSGRKTWGIEIRN